MFTNASRSKATAIACAATAPAFVAGGLLARNTGSPYHSSLTHSGCSMKSEAQCVKRVEDTRQVLRPAAWAAAIASRVAWVQEG